MPSNSKPAHARSGGASHHNAADSRKPGSRSPKHRGHRPDAEPATGKARPRWTADDRARRESSEKTRRDGDHRDRAGFRDRTGDAPREARESGRPEWSPRERPARGVRAGDGYRRDDRTGRPARDAAARDERTPRYDRSAAADRAPRYDRAERPERPARGEWTERPARGDRAQRVDRDDRAPRYDRPERAERPARPARGEWTDRPDRAPRQDRSDRAPRVDRAERPARTDRYERPARTERYGNAERAPRTDRYDRAERAPRYDRTDRTDRYDRAPRAGRDERSDRPARGDSAYYPTARTQAFEPREDVVLERLEAAAVRAEDVEGTTFADLGLGDNIVRQLASLGAEAPFPIQAATIPQVLVGRDVLGRGRTGSGKTIAFGAPLVERLLRDRGAARAAEETGGKARRTMGRAPRALILAPTRELAQQIDRTVQPIARSVGLFTVTIVGGVPQHSQVTGLQRGVDIVIGTPGRIEDLVDQGRLDLSEIAITVLDEADHMCDLGFLEPVQRILRLTREGGQKLLFSATLDTGVAALVDEFLVDPSVHEVEGEDQSSSSIEHRLLLIDQRDKRRIVEELVSGGGRSIVFTRTRAFAEELTEHLEDAGIPATSLHGDLTQSRRNRSLQRLTSGRVDVLVATDVAARGIHVDDVALVIQADAPEEYKTYLHRSGRTGRAGKQGTVVTLVNRQRRRRIDALLDRAEIDPIVSDVAPGDELLAELAAR